jgi:hypothetical protein
MSLVVADSVALTHDTLFPAWSPVVGWHNLVTADNVTAGTENSDYPAVNLATNRTFERWQALDTSEQRLVVTPNYMGDVDYIAVARHNFGTAHIEVSVEVYTELDVLGLPDWQEVVSSVMPADNKPLIFRFAPQGLLGICLRLRSGDAPPRAAVLYTGKLLILPSTLQTDFTPLNLGRVITLASNENDVGDYLGRTVLSQTLESTVRLMYLDPQWYRESMDPFVAASAITPFFFAWNPLEHPEEAGFAWIRAESNPQPRIYENVGLMSIELEMEGISQ